MLCIQVQKHVCFYCLWQVVIFSIRTAVSIFISGEEDSKEQAQNEEKNCSICFVGGGM